MVKKRISMEYHHHTIVMLSTAHICQKTQRDLLNFAATISEFLVFSLNRFEAFFADLKEGVIMIRTTGFGGFHLRESCKQTFNFPLLL